MGRRPPHIVVTTPESLYTLLGSVSGRKMLATTRTVIVDEIHAIAPNKRGSHLALSLERLAALCGHPLLRIGLSATQNPIEEVGRFLVGAAGSDCAIVDSGHRRARDLALEMPESPLEAVMSAEVWEQVYRRLAALIEQHRTTLDLRQHAAPGGAGDAPAFGAAGRGQRDGPSRQPGQGAAARCRAAAEARQAEGAGRHRLARARHRHRRRRSGVPARLAALDRELPAAHRPLGPRHRRHAQGTVVPAVARRAGRMRGAARQRPSRRARPPVDSVAAAGRAGAADRGRRRRARMERGRPLCAGAPRLALSRAEARGLRCHRRHAGRRLQHPPRPARRAPSS